MEDVAELLKTWELPELTPIFAEQRITLQALSAITQDDLKDLIPQIGTRVLFTRCWRTWKNEFSPVVDITNNIQTFSGLDLPNLQLDLELPNYQRDSSDYILMTVKDPEFLKGKLPDTLRIGPVARTTNNDSADKQLIQSCLQLCPNKSLVHVNWATVSTTRYIKGTILIYDTSSNDSLPTFFKVQNVYLYDSINLVVMGILMQTLAYDEHFFAYEVSETEAKENVVKLHKDLVSPIPCNINILSSGKKYVTLRCSL